MSFISVRYGQKFDPKFRERANKTEKGQTFRPPLFRGILNCHIAQEPVFGFKIMACFVDSAEGTIS